MVKKFIKLSLLFWILIALGCSYSLQSNQYPDLETVRIVPFENKTTESELAEDMLESITEQFQSDGRLSLVGTTPDILLEGKIKSYERKIYSSDSANNVEEYEIVMVFNIKMIDMVNDVVIYEDSSLRIKELYSVNNAESSAEYTSSIDAEQGIYEELFNKIMQNTLEDW
ncbi:MAG: hypothetical protein B6226_01690 [Candidatus Cloacimonetes bacterium 4572_65]|nr:MAG: hypothetical protein B6226_01690 [Candidatus Cloacimonetes bacterium 4572_65]